MPCLQKINCRYNSIQQPGGITLRSNIDMTQSNCVSLSSSTKVCAPFFSEMRYRLVSLLGRVNHAFS